MTMAMTATAMVMALGAPSRHGREWDEAGEDADGDRMPTWMKRQLRSNADEISEPESIEECSDEEAFGGGAPLHFHAE